MQKDLWEKEYRELKNLPSSRTMTPSRLLVSFIEEENPAGGSALDVGCGNGRNSIYLAQHGYEVTGVDIVESAVETAKQEAEKAGVTNRTKFLVKNIGEPLSFTDETFELIVDMMTMHLLNKEERKVYSKEVVRLLKPGGYFIFYTIAADSLEAQRLFKENPGPEENSYIIPQSGMVEKGFVEDDFRKMFSPLRFVKLDRKTEFTPAFGDVYERLYYAGVMIKK